MHKHPNPTAFKPAGAVRATYLAQLKSLDDRIKSTTALLDMAPEPIVEGIERFECGLMSALILRYGSHRRIARHSICRHVRIAEHLWLNLQQNIQRDQISDPT